MDSVSHLPLDALERMVNNLKTVITNITDGVSHSWRKCIHENNFCAHYPDKLLVDLDVIACPFSNDQVDIVTKTLQNIAFHGMNLDHEEEVTGCDFIQCVLLWDCLQMIVENTCCISEDYAEFFFSNYHRFNSISKTDLILLVSVKA